MRTTADPRHNELLEVLEDVQNAILVLAVVELMAQDRSRDAAIQQVNELFHDWGRHGR